MSNGWQFAARIQYPAANRGYEVKFSSEYVVAVTDKNSLAHQPTLDTGYWGPHVSLVAEEDDRICYVSFGLPKFLDAFEKAVGDFCDLRLQETFWVERWAADRKVRERAKFVNYATANYPSLLNQLESNLNTMLQKVREGKERLTALEGSK